MRSESTHDDPETMDATEPEPTSATAPRRESEAQTDPEAVLELDGVIKEYAAETAVNSLSLSVHEGELLTLLGPSGCGKTTTLRMMAGLERPDGGEVRLGGEVVADETRYVKPENRDVGLVFQDFALFPHLTVAENVAFGLTDADERETERRVDDLLELVDLAGHRDATPDELSGGQQQRVALARSLAPEPDILLLDEPFSNLDVRLRVEMREEVRRILKEAGVSAVSVTHDQEEALSISDRVAVMNDGQVEQVGKPESVFEHPESRFVASFLGQAGFLSAWHEEGTVVTPIGNFAPQRLNGLTTEYAGTDLDVLVRPDDLRATVVEESEADGHIIHRQYTGPSFVYRVELDNGDVVHCQHNHVEELDIGKPVRVALDADHTLAWYPPEEEGESITERVSETARSR
ncbi:ABC transporter ATP-binding protein [Halorussus sp. MSC15.2]|uniref:ABC transporter ATP-binding protein n=1 Tax=Halorussus sp. MSC15.2 TaxID=2283638 RepID=UPI0013D2A6E3|nr:ABC transporter ATP-binding protein [Halorussus sp. MSC15.2]NEU56998.1 ABC transporter ATP-binding protein [Halorussus sp. MSC15.2]